VELVGVGGWGGVGHFYEGFGWVLARGEKGGPGLLVVGVAWRQVLF
jgi:hypothetical protein